MKLSHGGDWESYRAQFGKDPLDFSANISPLGLPQAVKDAVVESLKVADRYPDPACRALRDALATYHQCSRDWIYCGNGAAELIFRLVLAIKPQKALIMAPTFSEYRTALETVGCTVQQLLLEAPEFLVTEQILQCLTPDIDLVFLCEPNNPTGRTTDKSLLKNIISHCHERQICVVVDECFGEFLSVPEEHSVIDQIGVYSNVIVLKAFTKSYAMAGLRLGYLLCSDMLFQAAVAKAGAPWSVSSVAEAAGRVAITQTAYAKKRNQLVTAQRTILYTELQQLGCTVVSGEANYLLFYHPAPMLFARLQQNGVLIRDCENYHGLSTGWYRIAVRTPEENQAFIKILKEVL